MLRSIAQGQRRELVFADLRPAVADLWRRHYALVFARFGPVGGLLLVLLTVVWASGEYAQRRAALLEAETQRYIEQFTEGPVAEARARLNSARHEDRPDHTTLRTAMAQAPNHEVARDLRLAQDIETVLRFYRRLALCIRMGSCDSAAAAAWFGHLPWRFHAQNHVYLKHAHPNEDLDALFRTISPRFGLAPASWIGLD